jgi:hypothetical protein
VRTSLLVCALLLGALSVGAAPKTITAGLGEEFTLLKGQRAALRGTDAQIRLTGFINSPCPKGVRCIWSGQKALLELTVAGATVPLNGSAPYRVAVLGSDYKTRAALRVDRSGADRPAP